jgi:histidine phosphotransfer protein HptB
MDIKALAENLGLEEDEYLELVDLLVETGMVDLNNMESAVKAGDADAAAKAAHSIKGASGNLGVMDIFELTKSVEAELRNNNLAGIEDQLKEIRNKLEALEKLVKE